MPFKVKKLARNWAIHGSVNKVRRRKEFPGLTKAEVEGIAADWTRQALNGEMPEQKAASATTSIETFEDAAIGYLEDGNYLKGVEEAIAHFQKTPLRDITPKDIRKFAKKTYGDKIPSRNRRGIAPVRAVINWAAGEGACGTIRVKQWNEPKAESKAAPEGWLTAFQEAARSMGPRFLGLAEMMEYEFRAGARTDECVKFTWDMMRWDELGIYLPKTKNHEAYTFPIPADMVPALQALRQQYADASEKGAEWEGKPIHHRIRERMKSGDHMVWPFPTKTMIWGLCKEVCAEAKIEYITPHKAGRHSFASNLHNQHDWSANDIAKAGRWKSVALVQKVYIHSDKTGRDATELTGKSLGKKKLRVVR